MDVEGRLENRPRVASCPKRAVKVVAPRDGREEAQDLAQEDGLMAGRHARTREIRKYLLHGRGTCRVAGAVRLRAEAPGCRERAA
jgi:hypothetical protein